MPETLDEAKESVAREFLGKHGVHGVGLSKARKAVRVYVHAENNADNEDLLAGLQEAAQPFEVIVVNEGKPEIT